MKHLVKLLVVLLGSFLLMGCSDDNAGSVPIGPISPIFPGAFDDRMLWQTDPNAGATATNNKALAQMMSVYGGVCWIDGYYPNAANQWVAGNRNCENYVDEVQVAFTYNEKTNQAEIFVKSWCRSGACGGLGANWGNINAYGMSGQHGSFVQFFRGAQPSTSYYPNTHVNFGPTYNNFGLVTMEQQTFEVEVLFQASHANYKDLEFVTLSLYYGDSGLKRKVGDFNLRRAK